MWTRAEVIITIISWLGFEALITVNLKFAICGMCFVKRDICAS